MSIRYIVVHNMTSNQIQSLHRTYKYLNVIFNFQNVNTKIITKNFEAQEIFGLLGSILIDSFYEIEVKTIEDKLTYGVYAKIVYKLIIPQYSKLNNLLLTEYGFIGNYIINCNVNSGNEDWGQEYYLKYKFSSSANLIYNRLVTRILSRTVRSVVIGNDSLLGFYKPTEYTGPPTVCQSCVYYNKHNYIQCAVHPLSDFDNLLSCKDYEPQTYQ